MAKRIGRIILGTVIVLIILSGVTAVISPPLVRKLAIKSYPQVEGEIQIPGLDDKVEIYRDAFGVPNIYAKTHHDLFFAQGYVHAQDRFWQMDFWRHQGAGRLSELVGNPMVETDKFLRTLGWERVAEQELRLLGTDELLILDAYSAGVNAYLQERSGTELSLEYAILPVLNAGYEPKPWTPLNSITWGKAMAWDLRANLGTEIDRAKLQKDISAGLLDFIYPTYPLDHPVIVPDFPLTTSSLDLGTFKETSQGQSGTTIPFSAITPMLDSIQTKTDALDQITGGGFEAIGSNSWAISGDLTDSGKPYLANDPHLGSQMPSIWYEVGLHCLEKTMDCQLDVAGFSFAGVPGIVIGHNDRIAWGFTNTGPDVMDLYIEKINPDHPTQYEMNGEWVEMETVIETIQVAGKDPVEHIVHLTQHGPVIGSVYGLDDFAEDTSLSFPDNYALALSWTALEPSCIFCAVWDFNLAQNWQEFRTAAADFVVPAQNLLYADVDGNIAYQMPGNIPIRSEGHDGMLPVPGWTGEYEWQGYIPFEELPYSLNPEEGYIVTANNAVVGSDYPYLISKEWSRGFRAQRIVDMLEVAPEPITMAYIKEMQGDNQDLLAKLLVPFLLEIKFTDSELMEAQQLLQDWDYQADMDSAPAALFMVYWQNLINNTVQDDLPDYYHVGVESTAKLIIQHLVSSPENSWWDDQTTDDIEIMEDILRLTFEESYREISKEQGKDPTAWKWGDLHTITFRNQVMNSFPFVNTAFNRGPFPAAGGNEIVNATGWDESAPYVIDWLPSMRMVVDLSDVSNSFTIHTTGQSGHAYHPHYIDMADLWRTIQYHPMLWTPQQIEVKAESLLILIP
ncbi:MAG: penicillin acylase family protein [Anaerolineales bacterium]|nr:penicillin acylase family protein [Anaerolineales bacterium]